MNNPIIFLFLIFFGSTYSNNKSNLFEIGDCYKGTAFIFRTYRKYCEENIYNWKNRESFINTGCVFGPNSLNEVACTGGFTEIECKSLLGYFIHCPCPYYIKYGCCYIYQNQ